MTIEFASNFPYHFSYISPLFGGSHRVPIALNDSNFDYGQDLFRIRHWVSQRKPEVMPSDNEKAQVYGVLSGHGRFWLNDIVTPATDEVVQSVIERKERESAQDPSQREEGASQSNVLIVSRGLTHPEPWAVRYSTVVDNKSLTIELVSQLLRDPPDAYITPTIAVYIVPR